MAVALPINSMPTNVLISDTASGPLRRGFRDRTMSGIRRQLGDDRAEHARNAAAPRAASPPDRWQGHATRSRSGTDRFQFESRDAGSVPSIAAISTKSCSVSPAIWR